VSRPAEDTLERSYIVWVNFVSMADDPVGSAASEIQDEAWPAVFLPLNVANINSVICDFAKSHKGWHVAQVNFESLFQHEWKESRFY
jgi:hypothetical protein